MGELTTKMTQKRCRLVFAERDYTRLHRHLFPGDDDEHGAVVLAGISHSPRETRLLVREVIPAIDGRDFVPGERSYRQLLASFIMPLVHNAGEEGLVYLAVHNHGGSGSVEFSAIDRDSHARNYPALLAITRGVPVGALVLAHNALAGSIWLDRNNQVRIAETHVVGPNRRIVLPSPKAGKMASDSAYDRQVRLLGSEGLARLQRLKVGVLGLGGVGMACVEAAGRLGVRHFVLADPDLVERSNLPRLLGAEAHDDGNRHRWWPLSLLPPRPRSKVYLASRALRRMPQEVSIEAFQKEAESPEVFEALKDCDFIFHAADTVRSRYFFNAVAHQYLIPGIQIGSKLRVAKGSGQVVEGTSIVRRIFLPEGCLLCRGVIDTRRLQLESMSESDRRSQNYVDGSDEPAPSIVTVNLLGVAEAMQSFLLHATGLWSPEKPAGYHHQNVLTGEFLTTSRAPMDGCPHCGQQEGSRFARGDSGAAPPPLGSAP